MASEQVTGPVAVFVSVPILTVQRVGGAEGSPSMLSENSVPAQPGQEQIVATSTPLFFGWGESAPEPEFLPEYENVMSDLRGSRKPHDKLYEGSDARVTITSTIFDEIVLQAMMAITKTNPPGLDGGLDIGTLMHAEKRSYRLWLVYPYIRKSFMQAANMRAGYRFFGAMLDGPIKRAQGTKVNKVLLSWYCGTPIIGGFYACYDGDMREVFGLPTPLNRR